MWSGPVGRSPVSIRKRAGSSVACSSMSASSTALRSRAAAYVLLSSVSTGPAGLTVGVVVGMVAVMGLSFSWCPRERPLPGSCVPDMRRAARGRLLVSGWFDGPPQLGSHHARVGATVELMSVRIREEDALGDQRDPAARLAGPLVGHVGSAGVGAADA